MGSKFYSRKPIFVALIMYMYRDSIFKISCDVEGKKYNQLTLKKTPKL